MSLPLILHKHDGFYTMPLFESFGVRALFTTRKYDMSFEGKGRKNAYAKMRIAASQVICPSQVHEDSVFLADEEHGGRGAYERATAIKDTDALMTGVRVLPLAILTADCLPVFILDPEKRAIAMVHAGWKGVHQKIIAKTVRKMSENFLSEPSNLVVALGPAIRSCCYEVGKEFCSYFQGYTSFRNSKYFFDLAGAAIAQLKEAGLQEGHIYDSRICTACRNDEFFSFRKEAQRAGRSMSLMELL